MPVAAHRHHRLHDNRLNPPGDDRLPAQRDRDRILYSSSFRRLAEVTQVVAANSGYVFHNRLTHSLQVAQVGRRLAEKLTLKQSRESGGAVDADVVEAACLAHDLGHPPFGHVAEDCLNDLARTFGGFEGNAQSFRIVTRLASRSRNYEGLDLTAATLGAILKYPWLAGENPAKSRKWGAYASESKSYNFAKSLLPSGFGRSPEAEIMDWADDVTYAVHDLEDFYRAGRMPLHLLAARDPNEREQFYRNVFQRRAGDPEFSKAQDLKEAFADVLISTFSLTTAYDGSSQHRAGLRDFTGTLIGRYINGASLDSSSDRVALKIDEGLRAEVLMLKELTWTYVIQASSLAAQQHGHRRVVTELFEIYREVSKSAKGWSIFPTFYRERLEKINDDEKRLRACIDLVASMTESQAIAMHGRLTGRSHGSGLDEILT